MSHRCIWTTYNAVKNILISPVRSVTVNTSWTKRRYQSHRVTGVSTRITTDISELPCFRYRYYDNTFLCNVSYQRRRMFTILTPVAVLRNECRGYKRKKNKGLEEHEEESSSDSESDEDGEIEDNLVDDDLDAPAAYKLMKLHVKSLRVDSIVSGGLDIARNRVDEIFYANKLRLSGNRLTKKSKQMSLGEYVDVITEKLEDVVKVKRVQIVKISSEKTRTDKFIVLVRVWKQPFEIINSDNQKY